MALPFSKLIQTKLLVFENGIEMEFKKYPVTINSFRHHNGGITMKTLKNATHRFFAFVLAFAMAVGIFSSTTAFATEASTNGIINHVVCHGSSQGYTSASYQEYPFTVEKGGVYYISFIYENESGNTIHNGNLKILNSKNEKVAGCTLTTDSNGGTADITLPTGTYKARVYPGETPYMYSFNIYWKEYKY